MLILAAATRVTKLDGRFFPPADPAARQGLPQIRQLLWCEFNSAKEKLFELTHGSQSHEPFGRDACFWQFEDFQLGHLQKERDRRIINPLGPPELQVLVRSRWRDDGCRARFT